MLSHDKLKALKQNAFANGGICCLTFYKQLTNDPRPYWMHKDISAQECQFDFGNPSGHITAIIMIWGIITREMKIEHCQYAYVMTFFYWVYVILVALSRLILGQHSLNQMLFGFVFGYYCYFLFFNYHSFIQEWYIPILNQKKLMLKSIIIILFGMFSYFVPLVLHYYSDKQKHFGYVELIQNKCIIDKKPMFFDKSLIEMSINSGIFSVLLLLTYSQRMREYYLTKSSNINYHKQCIKLLAQFVCLLITLIASYILFYKTLKNQMNEVHLVYTSRWLSIALSLATFFKAGLYFFPKKFKD